MFVLCTKDIQTNFESEAILVSVLCPILDQFHQLRYECTGLLLNRNTSNVKYLHGLSAFFLHQLCFFPLLESKRIHKKSRPRFCLRRASVTLW